MPLTPYLLFPGTCEEALARYATALGATVNVMMRHGEAPSDMKPDPAFAAKVMHANLTVGSDVLLMASDAVGRDVVGSEAITMSISEPDLAKAKALFAALSDGGEATMPLAPVFWGGEFGTLRDRYGMHWMISTGGVGE